jgi:transcriptional regulator with XRE-family HTH domain
MTPTVGDHLRRWRERRRLSQLDLACEAEISTRHLSYVETGRSQPSRDMVLRLTRELDLPLRDRNVMLVAAGYAPVFAEHALDADEMTAAREAMSLILEAHRPFPAYAIDRHWNMIGSNGALPQLYDGVSPDILEPPINVMRLALHPEGLASKIVNLAEWSGHLLERLQRQADLTADPVLIALMTELQGYLPSSVKSFGPAAGARGSIVVPFQIRVGAHTLSFMTTTMVFGAAQDVFLSEVTLEALYPADPETADHVRRGEISPHAAPTGQGPIDR